jgi:hypothetical protein
MFAPRDPARSALKYAPHRHHLMWHSRCSTQGAKEANVRTQLMLAVLLLSSLVAGVAEARHVRFAGPHPIAAKFGGGYCYIESPHMHIYAPDHQQLYQQVGDEYVFTGDPTPFGYDGDKHPYYGPHPIASVDGRMVYCYIDGPHFHPMAAPDDGYKTKNGVAFYVGPFTPEYTQMRPHRAKLVNEVYRPYVAYRPTVEVEPPPEWHGEVYVAPPAVEVSAPGVVINAPGPPGVVVEAPAPHVVIAPPAPHVIVAPPAPHVLIAPPAPHVYVGAPPAPHVYVGAPPAPHVYVGAPPPPGVVVVKTRRVEERHEEHWERRGRDDEDGDHQGHHDNGKHKGWYK